MKKRLLSILLMCCMVLTLLPTAAFAEGSEEELPVCTCETSCTVESMNDDCPVCGAEGASAENCAKYIKPADDAAVQPEGEVSDPQPKTALTALIGGSETPAASGAVTDVSTAADLIAAIANSAVGTVKLAGDISISTSLTVKRTVTLDLNGHVLKYESANEGSVIVVEGGGNLTLTDSNDEKVHRFNKSVMPWALAADDATGENFVDVSGGVITGGTGTDLSTYGGTTWYCGGGALIKNGGSLTMRGGNIIGCSAECGGGVCIDSERNGEPGQFSMSGGSIIGCVASNSGGGVFASGKFQMSDKAVIRSCTVESTIQLICGGGVYVNGSSSFEMSGEAKIEGCQAISTSAYGGGVYVSSSSSFVMTAKAEIEGCRAISNSANSSKGGGVHLANATTFTLSGSAVIQNCTATNSVNSGKAYGGGVSAACVWEITLEDNASIAGCIAANGSGLYITGSQLPGYGKLFANGGSVDGDVVLGDPTDTTVGPGTITGTGETKFNGKVTVTTGSTIESGKFNGEVINNGTITGGTFTGTVINNGTITDGTFSGKPARITGSGTETDPYQISTAEGLKWFRDKVNSAKTKEETKICAVLTEDIDLNNEPWTPIGPDRDSAYTGTFDGQGHTVKNLSVTVNVQPGRAGLFGCVKDGTIRKLTVAGSVSCTANQGWCGGIAGYAMDETIENCASLCTVSCTGIDARVGGIVGLVDYNSRTLIIRDCYNIGKITGRSDNGSGDAGGICGFYMNGKISNCYNVGEITGSGYVSKIAVSAYNDSRPTNCYYLSDTDTDLNGTAKTAAEFANGDVLDELKAGRNDSPWDSCQYVAAAKITLPVFKGQGDAHEHNGNWTSNGDGTHSRHCTCNAVETQNCSGGKATCKDKAVCEICKESYGSLDPNSHTDLKHVDAKAATAAEEGNIEYWYCKACEKYFSDADAKNGITQAQTVIPKRQSSGSNYSYYTIKATAGTGGAISPSGNVSVRGGRDQTFTITPDQGYTVSDVKIDGESVGAVTSYSFENVRKAHTIAVSFATIKIFVDVPAGSYYEDAVDWAVENGITNGVSSNMFAPDDPCTRAQIVTFLWRAAGSPAPKSMSSFTDVPADAFYAKAVAWAVENGITSGTGEGKFSPNAICTRAQSVTFLYRASGSPAVSGSAEFSDVSTTAFYADAVAWAAKKGITTGIGGGLFGSDNDCTRSQIVTFLWRCKK